MNREPKILLVEDSPDYQTLISESLSHYRVQPTPTAEGAWQELLRSHYDLILLDIGLPDKSGFSLLSDIQSHASIAAIPIICITGRTQITDKVTAFSLGADDYLQKPFDLLELKARVDAKLAKARRQKDSSRMIRIGNLKMDLNSHQVLILDSQNVETEITLTQTEFKLLTLFSKNPSKVFSREQILVDVWGNGVKVSDRVIDVHLCSLRKKIKAATVRIQPVTGHGYKLTTQPDPAPALSVGP